MGVALEVHNFGVAEEGAPDGDIGVGSADAGEVAGDDMVCNDIRQNISVRSYVRGNGIDWDGRQLERSR